MLQDRNGKLLPDNNTKSGLLLFLYQTRLGRFLLKGVTRPTFSRLYARHLKRPASRKKIAPFIERYHIPIDDYIPREYTSFDDFFTRRIRPEKRPIDPNANHLIAPADGRLSVVPITDQREFFVKGQAYSLSRLVKGAPNLEDFKGGVALILRLAETDYHHYHFIDDGEILAQKALPGRLHTIRPIALAKRPVFIENQRVWTAMATKHFGPVIQVEVGALTVGKIHNSPNQPLRGAEKGYFSYGGSTIILLFARDRVLLDDDLWASRLIPDRETLVRLGEKIGEKTHA